MHLLSCPARLPVALAGCALLLAALPAAAEPGRSHPGSGAAPRAITGGVAMLPARRVPPAALHAAAAAPAPAERRYGMLRRDADGALTEAPASAAILALLEAAPGEGPGAGEHARGGPDLADRRQVTSTEGFPARAVGMVYAVHGEVAVGCTGTLIGPASVLTAAGCIHDPVRGWPARILFVPAMPEAGEAPLGVWPWASATVPPAHLDSPGAAAPGVVTLAAPLGETVGWLGFAAAAEAEVIATLYGYPEDAPPGSLWQAACALALPVAGGTEAPGAHGCPGFAGIAGGAIHVYSPADDQRLVLGLSLPAAAADGASAGLAIGLTPARVQWLAELWR